MVNMFLDSIFLLVFYCCFLFSIFLYHIVSKKSCFVIFLIDLLVTMIVFHYWHFSFIFRILSVFSIVLIDVVMCIPIFKYDPDIFSIDNELLQRFRNSFMIVIGVIAIGGVVLFFLTLLNKLGIC